MGTRDELYIEELRETHKVEITALQHEIATLKKERDAALANNSLELQRSYMKGRKMGVWIGEDRAKGDATMWKAIAKAFAEKPTHLLPNLDGEKGEPRLWLGDVMKATHGRFDPAVVEAAIKEVLS